MCEENLSMPICDIVELQNEIEQLKVLLRECKETIYNLIDDEPCWHDHHGYCQAHGWMSNDMCPNEQGKNLLAKIDNAIGENNEKESKL